MTAEGAKRRSGGRSGLRPKRLEREPATTPPTDRAEVALYICCLAAEMVELARHADFKTLAYLADMVRMEADQQGRLLKRKGVPAPRG